MIELDCYYLKTRFKHHYTYKDYLLSEFEKYQTPSDINTFSVNYQDNNYYNKINKVDYHNGRDFNRPWVKRIHQAFQIELYTLHSQLGFDGHDLKDFWFQQYVENDKHDWHTHGENYTGVYYVEMPDGAPGTELYSRGKILCPKVEEGDIVIFPSIIPHRAPLIKSNLRKTIISFNIQLEDFSDSKIEEMNNATA